MKTSRPFSLGFNGHAKSCDCPACAQSRVDATEELWKKNGSYAIPKTVDATVFVASYFRRQAGHYKKKPNSRRLIGAMVRGLRSNAE